MNRYETITETSKILDQLENTSFIDGAIGSLCSKSDANCKAWREFCAEASVIKALGTLNVDSPIFHSFTSWLEIYDRMALPPHRKELEVKVGSLWCYYQGAIAPILINYLTDKLEDSNIANCLRLSILNGNKLTKEEREEIHKIDKCFESVRNVNDLVVIAGLPNSSSYLNSSEPSTYEELVFFFKG